MKISLCEIFIVSFPFSSFCDKFFISIVMNRVGAVKKFKVVDVRKDSRSPE